MHIDGVGLDVVPAYKYLGVTVDKELKWDTHVSTVLTKLKRALGMMRQVRPFVTKTALVTLYNSIFLPHLTYNCTLWDGASIFQINRLQRMQNKVGKLILGLQPRTS